MLKDFLYAQWAKPAVRNPPPRSVNDWIIVVVLSVSAITEAIFRTDLWMPGLAAVLGVVPAIALLWRRSDPLAAILVAFSAHAASEFIPALAGEESIFAYSSGAYAVILPYALFRWGSGRQAALGLGFILITHMFAHPLTLVDAGLVVAFFLFPAEIGASVRYRAEARRKLIEKIKLEERQEIARELHDTVAHHVSAIAIRAQAGRVQATNDPAAALAALEVIEQEASRTLTQMRSMVGILRSSDVPDLAPQPGVAELAQFARNEDELPRITVDVSSDAGEPAAPVGAAIYRIAQESITNALRHARQPCEISVSVGGDSEYVRLSVLDDGGVVPSGRGQSGFGLVGMEERAKLLGGTLEAGPAAGHGWKVEAVLPRVDSAQ